MLIVNSHPKEIYRTSPEGLLSYYGDTVTSQPIVCDVSESGPGFGSWTCVFLHLFTRVYLKIRVPPQACQGNLMCYK